MVHKYIGKISFKNIFPTKLMFDKHIFPISENCYFLTGKNILKSPQGNFIIGCKFENKSDLYITPLPSSSIYEYLESRLSALQKWNVSEIMCKAFIVPVSCSSDNTFAVFPIKHE